jgi:hypothetical protein
MAEVNFTHGMNVNFRFANSTADMSRHLLGELGFPFRKDEKSEKDKKSSPTAPTTPSAPKTEKAPAAA